MILIVDDHADTAEALKRLLRHFGQEAATVPGGAEALAMLRVRKPTLMVLDVQMPGMDGMAVLRAMKAHDDWKDVRVLMYSADTQHQTMVEARRLGAADFLVKGTVGIDTLVARIVALAGAAPGRN